MACLLCGLCACGSSGDSAPANEPPDAQTESGNNGENNSENSIGQPVPNPEELTAFERLFASGPLAAQDTSELWGYIDSSGAWVIPPTFAEARNFWSSGLALAKDVDNQLWGLIDTSGNYVVQPTFDNIGNAFGDDLFRVRVPERGWGYIDVTGALVIEPQFDEAGDFSEGLAKVSSQIQFTNQGQNYYQLWGYINASGEKVIEESFSEAYDFSEGLACVKYGDVTYGTYGYIDAAGNNIIPPSYYEATSFSHGRAFVYEPAAGAYNETWAIIDTEGNWLTDQSGYEGWGGWFDTLTKTSSNQVFWNYDLTPVRLTNGTGYVYINYDGEIVLPKVGSPYQYAYGFSSGYAAAADSETGLLGYIDLDGNWVIPPQYSNASSYTSGLNFVYGYAIVTAGTLSDGFDSRYLLIDENGNCILDADDGFTPYRSYGAQRCFVRENSTGKIGIFNIEGGSLTDCIYDAVWGTSYNSATDSHCAVVSCDGPYGIIDGNGNWLIPACFLQIKI